MTLPTSILCFGVICQVLAATAFQHGPRNLDSSLKPTVLRSMGSESHNHLEPTIDTTPPGKIDIHKSSFSISRRALGRVLISSISGPALAQAMEGNDSSSVEVESATKYSEAGGAFRASNAWEQTASGGFKDRFTGKIVVSSVRVSATPTTLSSIRDLGKVENVKVAQSIPSLGVEDLIRGDLVAASVRTDDSGVVYYGWDLALAPAVCAEGEQFGGALGCSYDRIYLVAASVKDSMIHTLFVQATAEEWKGHGLSLRRLRDSFEVPSGSA